MIWRWFWREWRTPSLLIVWLAFTLAVACVMALSSISERMNNSLHQKSRDFLAGDRVLRSNYPIEENWLTQAKQRHLTVSQQISFMTMSYAHDKLQLTQVKATDQHYPLYGDLKTLPPHLKVSTGSVLVEPRLLSILGLSIGDPIEIGDATLVIVGQLLEEPDAGFNPLQTAPRVLMDLKDIQQTGAISPGSRLTYRYMFAGDTQAIEQFSQFIQPQLKSDQRWYSVENSGNAVERSLKRANNFLLLSGALTLLLSAAAITVAMNHYCRSRYDLVAILKTLGASRKKITLLVIGQWAILILFAYLAGSGLGILFEHSLIYLLQSVLPPQLASASWQPWFWSLGLLLTISLLIGLRPYRQLLATPPLRILRENMLAVAWPLRYYLPLLILILLTLLLALIGFNTLWWSLLLAIFVLALLLGLIAWCSLLLLRRITVNNISLRLAINRLLRQPWSSFSQLSTFALSFMLLTLLLMLRGDLLDRWQQQLPPDTPNYYVLNITPNQRNDVQQFLEKNKILYGDFYPIVLARLSHINQQPVTDLISPDESGYEAIDRELSLTWLYQQKITNPIIRGQWPPKQGEVSIEQGVADRLHVSLGSKLTFSGAGGEFSATISSIRHVDWQSLKPNFYFIFPSGALDAQAQSWLTSFHWQGGNDLLNQFNRQFPTLTLLDVDTLLQQISQIMKQVSRALEVMVVLVVICGFLLLLAQLQVGMQLRQQELTVYRILGASKRLLRSTLFNEFALLGLTAGLAAAIGSEIALFLLQTQVFDFTWTANYWMWLWLPLCSSLLLSLCGTWLAKQMV